jgi:hypothetical protein
MPFNFFGTYRHGRIRQIIHSLRISQAISARVERESLALNQCISMRRWIFSINYAGRTSSMRLIHAVFCRIVVSESSRFSRRRLIHRFCIVPNSGLSTRSGLAQRFRWESCFGQLRSPAAIDYDRRRPRPGHQNQHQTSALALPCEKMEVNETYHAAPILLTGCRAISQCEDTTHWTAFILVGLRLDVAPFQIGTC